MTKSPVTRHDMFMLPPLAAGGDSSSRRGAVDPGMKAGLHPCGQNTDVRLRCKSCQNQTNRTHVPGSLLTAEVRNMRGQNRTSLVKCLPAAEHAELLVESKSFQEHE